MVFFSLPIPLPHNNLPPLDHRPNLICPHAITRHLHAVRIPHGQVGLLAALDGTEVAAKPDCAGVIAGSSRPRDFCAARTSAPARHWVLVPKGLGRGCCLIGGDVDLSKNPTPACRNGVLYRVTAKPRFVLRRFIDLFYKLSPKSLRNFATSCSCQSPMGSRRPKKKRSDAGSSTKISPPTRCRFSYSQLMRSTA